MTEPLAEIALTGGGGFALDITGTLACWGNYMRGTCATGGHAINVPTPIHVR